MESTTTAQLATNSAETITRYQFLDFGYWFSTPNQGSLNHWPVLFLASISSILLIVVLILIAIKVLKSNLNPPQQKFLTKLIVALSAFGPIGWMLVCARLLAVVFFSARFWWVVWFSGLLLVLYWLYREFKKIPARQAAYQTYQLKKRYFPKKHKR